MALHGGCDLISRQRGWYFVRYPASPLAPRGPRCRQLCGWIGSKIKKWRASPVRGDLVLTRDTTPICSERPPPDLPTRMPREGWPTPLLPKWLQKHHSVAPPKKS